MDKTKKIASFLFVVLFASYYAGTIFFDHTHLIEGAVITHSHFHKDSHHDTKSGNHTKQSITLIAQFSHFEYIDFSCNCVLEPLQLSLVKSFINTIYFYTHLVCNLYIF